MLEKNHESPSWLVSGLEKRTILSDSFKRGLNRFVLLVLFSMYLLNISAGIVPLLCRLEFTSRCHWVLADQREFRRKSRQGRLSLWGSRIFWYIPWIEGNFLSRLLCVRTNKVAKSLKRNHLAKKLKKLTTRLLWGGISPIEAVATSRLQ